MRLFKLARKSAKSIFPPLSLWPLPLFKRRIKAGKEKDGKSRQYGQVFGQKMKEKLGRKKEGGREERRKGKKKGGRKRESF